MSTTEEQRTALIEQLAVLVLEDRRAETERNPRHTPYYFLNIHHPVMQQFYLAYMAKAGEATPPGDLCRTRFELSMLHPAVLRRLAAYYREQGRL